MAESLIQLERDGAVATVTLNRPAKLNSLTPVMLDQLELAARELDAASDVRIVILLGGGEKAFCVGADINEWAALQPLDMWRRWVRRGHQVFDQWARLRQPVITAINGHAFGGGLELAITGDIRIAVDSAQFALPEASIATCPGWSGTQRLVQLVGASRAKYLALSGTRLSASDALNSGLVHEVVSASELRHRVTALAREMSAKAPVSLQLTKQLINAAAGEDTAATLEAMAGALAATTQDAAEGIRSFREKRAPSYLGH
ncbi:enoyl-CoA hydratase/isomerase family protein [Variovorax sp. J22R133]|uniref:enoyl-CoA hydratase/isomerase family protein n=1 Tax=Variovorax brevis TaxID=3053503 RepID=UPI0025763BF3|nr:enoyl-CoA hydratase/isomerase family protein [Variovorax sp. J22R133]MDM0111217.1 enoyl-CoA hydratase/isomerase family protein [Variovorax sp. J22R133]